MKFSKEIVFERELAHQGTSKKEGMAGSQTRLCEGLLWAARRGRGLGRGSWWAVPRLTIPAVVGKLSPSYGQQMSAQSRLMTRFSFRSYKNKLTREFYNLWLFLK